jgi:hypothetical protein
MLIISSRGELKATPADISVLGSPGTPRRLIGAKRTIAIAATRAAGEVAPITWDTTVYDNGGFVRAGSNRLWIPQSGWYMANFYVQTASPTAHTSVAQIQAFSLQTVFAYRKRRLGVASSTYPGANSVTGKTYLEAGDSIYIYWGVWDAASPITCLTGEANVGFAVWKTS